MLSFKLLLLITNLSLTTFAYFICNDSELENCIFLPGLRARTKTPAKCDHLEFPKGPQLTQFDEFQTYPIIMKYSRIMK